MAQIFTFEKLKRGRVFDFYSYEKRLCVDDEIEIWYEKSNNGLGDPIVYGRARVTKSPDKYHEQYTALVLSSESCN